MSLRTATGFAGVPLRSGAGLLSISLLLVSVGWSLRFIWNTSFLYGSQRVFSLFDDAMISLTYARSLAEGRGLTWGLQEAPVEGFTNPLWTLIMSLVELAPLADFHRPLLVQLLGLMVLLGCWWALVRLLLRFLRLESKCWVVAFAGACLAVYPLWYWSLLGLEVGLQSLLLIWLATVSVTSMPEERTRGRELLLAATAPLVRMDVVLGLVICLAALWMRGSRRKALRMAAASSASLFCYQCFRWSYFGDSLPNTYYLKMTGESVGQRISRGLELMAANPTLALLAMVLLLAGGWMVWLRDIRKTTLVSIPLAYMAYTVYVGGDAWDLEFAGVSRFTASALPLGLCAVVTTLDRMDSRRPWPAALALLALVPIANGWIGPDGTERRARQMSFGTEPYLVASHRLVFSEVMALEQRFGRHDLSVTTCWAGIPAYFSDFRWIDCLGYTDRELARLPVNGPKRALARGIVAGHNKRYPDRVLDRDPDVVYQLWGYGEVEELLNARGYRRTAEGWWIKRGLLKRLRTQE